MRAPARVLVGRTPVKRAREKFARAALRWQMDGRSNRPTEGGDPPMMLSGLAKALRRILTLGKAK